MEASGLSYYGEKYLMCSESFINTAYQRGYCSHADVIAQAGNETSTIETQAQ